MSGTMSGIQGVRAGLATVLAMLLAGCATAPEREPDSVAQREGEVGYTEVSELGKDHIELGANEIYQPPLPSPRNALPQYPQDMLDDALPMQVVCVQASISPEGAVTATAPVFDLEGCPQTGEMVLTVFYEAAASAVQEWHYEPAFRCIFQSEDARRDLGCAGVDVREVPLAVRLNYRFEFEQAHGQGQVRMTGG